MKYALGQSCARCGFVYTPSDYYCHCDRIDHEILEREILESAAKMTSGYVKTYPLPVDLPPELPLPGERWKHYKGGTYEVLMLARHTESNDALVIYRSLKHGTTWARPLSVWQEWHSSGVRRFVRL